MQFRSLAPCALLFTVLPLAAQIPADLHLEDVITSGLSSPVALRHSGDGSGRLFLVERTGQIKIFADGSLNATSFLSIAHLISASPNERGLLGLAFHPQFASNRKFYVNYTDTSGNTRIVEYLASLANPDVADTSSARILLTINQPDWNHNGGNLLFGPDGYLYIGMGDGGGSGGSGQGHSLNLGNLLGKMLRIDVDVQSSTHAGACGAVAGTLSYGIPADNPFAAGGGCAEIVHIGLRNPWRWSFDRSTGDLFIADVGQSTREEVNFAAVTELNQVVNYGWKCFEGTLTYASCPGGMAYPHRLPFYDYPRSGGNCSVTGGYRYRGPITGLNGVYIFTDYCNSQIRFASHDGSSWSVSNWGANQGFGVASFGEDEAGNVYTVNISNGVVKRFASNEVGPVFYTVTPNAGSGGSIDPDTPQEVESGDTTDFEILPDPGFVIDSVVGCAGSLDGSTYTTGEIIGDCDVTASFELETVTHTVTPSAGAGGSIDPDTPQEVESGATTEFEILPDAGFVIDSVVGCGGALDGNIYTTGAITEDCDVVASFEVDSDQIFRSGFELSEQ